MDVDSWAPAEQLWRRWGLLAAGHAALERAGCTMTTDPLGETVAELRSGDGAWLRMRRLRGGRAVMWGCQPHEIAHAFDADALFDETPDWAVDSETADRWAADAVCVTAWFAQNSWSSVESCCADALAELIGPVLTLDALSDWWEGVLPRAQKSAVAEALSAPSTASLSDVLDPGAARAAVRVMSRVGDEAADLSAAARAYLRAEIYAQMRASSELEVRDHPKRPILLRQWARVNATRLPFRCAVYAEGTELTGAGDNAGLGEPQRRSLLNVLRELRSAETSQAGAWLFARVTSDGRQVTLERRYDGWPAWFTTELRPGLRALAEEMDAREERWRPAWSGLLPTRS